MPLLTSSHNIEKNATSISTNDSKSVFLDVKDRVEGRWVLLPLAYGPLIVALVLKACGLTDSYARKLYQREDASRIEEDPATFIEGAWEKDDPFNDLSYSVYTCKPPGPTSRPPWPS